MTENVPAVVMMSAEEARAEHEAARGDFVGGFGRLANIRDREGWKALGFGSWDEYLAVAWGWTRNYANRQIDHERFKGEIEAAVGTAVPGLTEGNSRAARKQREATLAKIKKRTAGLPAEAAAEEARAVLAEAIPVPLPATVPIGTTPEPPAKEAQEAQEPDPLPTPAEVPAGGLVVRDLRLPTALNHAAEERADDAGITMNEYVVALIQADLDPIPGAKVNGQARQRERVGAMAGASTPARSPASGHTHKPETRGISGMVKCKCGASKQPKGDGWIEP